MELHTKTIMLIFIYTEASHEEFLAVVDLRVGPVPFPYY